MKYFIFLCALFIIPFSGNAQKVNNVPLKEISAPYIKVSAYNNFRFNGTVGLRLDYGQRIPKFKVKESAVVKSDDDKIIAFNSLTDGINFLHQFDYEIFDILILVENDRDVLYYLMKKKDYEGTPSLLL